MRSTLIDMCRKAAPTVFNLPGEYFTPGYERATVPEIVALLKFNPTIDGAELKQISKHPPVLFPQKVRRKGKYNSDYGIYLFQSEYVFRVRESFTFLNANYNMLIINMLSY